MCLITYHLDFMVLKYFFYIFIVEYSRVRKKLTQWLLSIILTGDFWLHYFDGKINCHLSIILISKKLQQRWRLGFRCTSRHFVVNFSFKQWFFIFHKSWLIFFFQQWVLSRHQLNFKEIIIWRSIILDRNFLNLELLELGL